MNPKFLLSTLITSLILPSIGFAFFCPTNFNQIEFGMTIEQVTELCGKPVSQKDLVKPNENIPQEWTYYIPQAVGMSSMQQKQGTLKTSVSFDDKGKAINISVNGIGVGASTICGSNVQLGDSRETIETACGKPNFINKQSADVSSDQPKEIKVVEFNYSTANPPAILIFEDGKLTEKK